MTTAERNAIPSPATSLLIFNTTTGCFEFWDGSSWIALTPCAGGCVPPGPPTAGSHSSTETSITWGWTAVSGATAYWVNTTNNVGTATNIGNVTSYNQTGLSCGTNYTLYVWAENSCGTSATAAVLTYSTAACVPVVSCGTQVFMQQNMDVGTMINGSAEQDNNSVLEKYCYNNTAANCATYGGLYQWAEALQLPYIANSNSGYGTNCDPCGSGGIQGICPSGYHVPTDLEFSRYEWCVENNIAPADNTPLSIFQTGTFGRGSNSTAGPGHKMKASSSDTPSWDGSNASGFTALPAGYRYDAGGFNLLGSGAYFWTATENSAPLAWSHRLRTGNFQSFRTTHSKTYGFSVRCLQN